MQWIDTTVGQYCPFIYGKGLPQRKREKGNVPVYGSNGVVDIHNESCVKGHGLIIGRKGSVGAVHLSKVPFWPIDTSFYVEKKSIEELYFTYYLLKSLGLEQMNSDSAVPGLNRDNAHALSIRIPESEDDRKLVGSWVATFDEKVAFNTQTNQTLEAIGQAIFKSWFVDFDPVKAKIAVLESGGSNADAELAAMSVISSKNLTELTEFKQSNTEEYKQLTQTAALFPSAMEESELGTIPEGWEVKFLREIIEFNPRRKLVKGTLAPYLDMKNVPTEGHLANDVILREMASGTKFINGDTLLARITPCLENGKTAFVDFLEEDQVGWGSTEYIVMRPQNNRPTSLGYMIARLDSFRAKAAQTMTGTSGRQRANASALAEQKWINYPSELLEAFDRIAGGYLFTARANGKQNKMLTDIRNAILPKLLSGELKVK
jgi:type I restriction enzyme S subunit